MVPTRKMNKLNAIIFGISFLFCAALFNAGSVTLVHLLHQDKTPLSLLFTHLNAPRTRRIAFFIGAHIPAIEQLKKGALDCTKAYHVPFEHRSFYYDQNQSLLTHQINEALNSRYDLLIPIGTNASQMTHRQLSKRSNKTPMIFSSVTDPVQSGLSNEKYRTGFNSTGFSESYHSNIDIFVKALKTVRPDARSVLVIYTPTVPLLQEQVRELTTECAKHRLAFDTLEVFNCGEVYEKARTRIKKNVDVVVILREYNTTSALQALIKLCEETGTTLFASDKSSVEQGAAAGYCIDEYDLGLILGTYIQKVLQENKPAGELPVMYLNVTKICRLHINPFALHKQGVTAPLKELMSLPRVSIIQK
mgnify:CR=1 FL=1